MDKNVLQFEISSPAQLQEALADDTRNNAAKFAAVKVFGPSVLTRQFNFPRTSVQDLVAGLKMEASETLSVQADDVEMTYQITSTDDQNYQGIYSVMPRQLLLEYLECFKAHPLIPVSLTASAVDAVIDFLKDQVLPEDNFCLVNFLKSNVVNVIIFNNAMPTFFRELYDLSESDYKDKIKDTIRYSCSQSSSKSINQIFFIGDLKGKDDLIKNLKELEHPSSAQPVSAEGGLLVLTSLNLFGKFVLGLTERMRLVFIYSLISMISIALASFLAWYFINGNAKLQAVKSKVNMSDYKRALDLQKQVGRLSHAK